MSCWIPVVVQKREYRGLGTEIVFEAATFREAEMLFDTADPTSLVTTNAFEEDCTRCLQTGMDDYLAKPVCLEDLRAALQRRLPRRTSACTCPHADREEPGGGDGARS